MPDVTYDGHTKSGIILYYIAEDQELYLPYVHSLAPDAYTVYKAADQYGNYEPAWSVTDLGWQSLREAIRSVVDEYDVGHVTYSGVTEEEIKNFTVAFDPD